MPTSKAILEGLRSTAAAVQRELAALGPAAAPAHGRVQTDADIVADRVAVASQRACGFGVFSEESGGHDLDAETVILLDPVDGSENRARGIGFSATSLCAIGPYGPIAALVLDLVSGSRYEAVRGGGATCEGVALRVSGARVLSESFVALSGHPTKRPARATRSLGAAALELCKVAHGTFDAYIDVDRDHHGLWDLAAGALICEEAGGLVCDVLGRDVWPMDVTARRTFAAAGTSSLLRECLEFAADHLADSAG
jgi:fructose-1,6-bisphosphatase/inositol monophosphatase family enzyme